VTIPFLGTPISRVGGVARLAILFGNDRAAGPKQELLPHLTEARTAKFAVKQLKYRYNRHDRTPYLIIAVNTPSTHLDAYRM